MIQPVLTTRTAKLVESMEMNYMVAAKLLQLGLELSKMLKSYVLTNLSQVLSQSQWADY